MQVGPIVSLEPQSEGEMENLNGGFSGKKLLEVLPKYEDLGFPLGYDDVPDKIGPDGRPIPFSRFWKEDGQEEDQGVPSRHKHTD